MHLVFLIYDVNAVLTIFYNDLTFLNNQNFLKKQ